MTFGSLHLDVSARSQSIDAAPKSNGRDAIVRFELGNGELRIEANDGGAKEFDADPLKARRQGRHAGPDGRGEGLLEPHPLDEETALIDERDRPGIAAAGKTEGRHQPG